MDDDWDLDAFIGDQPDDAPADYAPDEYEFCAPSNAADRAPAAAPLRPPRSPIAAPPPLGGASDADDSDDPAADAAVSRSAAAKYDFCGSHADEDEAVTKAATEMLGGSTKTDAEVQEELRIALVRRILKRDTRASVASIEESELSRWERGLAVARADSGVSDALLSRPPADGSACIELSLPTAGRFYVRVAEDVAGDARRRVGGAATKAARQHLLGEPIADLLMRVRERSAAQIQGVAKNATEMSTQADADAAANTAAAATKASPKSPSTGASASAAALMPKAALPAVTSALWVDKYAPKKFAELLSSEFVNRNVMRWVKLWDPIVFSRPGPMGFSASFSAPGIFSRAPQQRAPPRGGGGDRVASAAAGDLAAGGGAGAGDRAAAAPVTVWDLFGPAWNVHAKALLLCGAPGTGKTTLAHIVAELAGYRILEINASDERSRKSIRELVANAQSSQSVSSDKRPTAVILDEIDGMDAAAIAELVQMLKATPSPFQVAKKAAAAAAGGEGEGEDAAASDNDEGDDDEGSYVAGGATAAVATGGGAAGVGKRRKVSSTGRHASGGGEAAKRGGAALVRLTRPLLCICNDQFAPALRELKSLVQVVEFGQTTSEKLIARLKNIAASEGMTIARDALNALVALTDNDVRSCLNTLQFLKAQVARTRAEQQSSATSERIRVTSDMLLRAAVGSKDMTGALYDIWGGVFRSPDLRGRPGGGLVSALRRGIGVAADASLAFQNSTEGKLSAYREELFSAAGSFASEADFLLAGVYENLHESRASDATLRGVAASLDWLCFGDEVSSFAQSRQLHTMLKYVPAAVVGVHLRVASELRMRCAWPRGETSFRSLRDSRTNILRSFLLAKAVAVRGGALSGISTHTAVLDILSPVITIALCANLRPVSFTLANSKERKLATDVVQTLTALGLTFSVRSKSQDAFDAEYTLQPFVSIVANHAANERLAHLHPPPPPPQ